MKLEILCSRSRPHYELAKPPLYWQSKNVKFAMLILAARASVLIMDVYRYGINFLVEPLIMGK